MHCTEGRTIDKRRGYRIHMNLHKMCFSVSQYVVEKKGWRVTDHVEHLEAENVKFKVSEKSRQRAINKGARNVHAYAYADQVKYLPKKPKHTDNVCNYNPFKNPFFFNLETGEEVKELQHAHFKEGKICY
jgi:hypothetical protein